MNHEQTFLCEKGNYQSATMTSVILDCGYVVIRADVVGIHGNSEYGIPHGDISFKQVRTGEDDFNCHTKKLCQK
jgi:hypothetical protein